MNKLVIYGAIVLLILVSGFFLLSNKSSSPSDENSTKQETITNNTFDNPKKSAHYESNTPEHGSTLAGVPINVVINFNFDLAAPSEIKIEKDGKDYGTEETKIDSNKLSMRRVMDPNAPDGIYTVKYKACWSDGSCHDGYFQFAIDKAKESAYQDMSGRREVTIKMSQIKFMPTNVKISKGTKVTWINDDKFDHYVNTDSHPAHTYYLDQNSKALKKGASYSVTFNTLGIYPYHCSAHAESMTGSILVK